MYKPSTKIVGQPNDFPFSFSLTLNTGEIILVWSKSLQERTIWVTQLQKHIKVLPSESGKPQEVANEWIVRLRTGKYEKNSVSLTTECLSVCIIQQLEIQIDVNSLPEPQSFIHYIKEPFTR